MVTMNGAKGILAVVALLCSVALTALIIKVQRDPMTLTTKHTVTNVELPVKPIEAEKVAQVEPQEITLEPVVITGELRRGGPGAAMVKKPAAKPKCSSIDGCDPKACKLSYRVVGFNDDKFESFRGVYECVPR